MTVLEPEKKLLETQAKDARSKLDEAKQNLLKGGKKAMNKMDTRIHDSKLDAGNNDVPQV